MTRTGHIATLLLVLLALIGCSNTATDTLDQSAAALTLEPIEENQQEAGATNGKTAVLLRTDERARFELGDVQSGTYEVSVRARGDNYQGWPEMRLEVDGQQRGEDRLVGSNGYLEYSFGEVALSPGQAVEVVFKNDNYDGSADRDRNLYVDHLILEPVARIAPEPESPDAKGVIALPLEVIGPDGYIEGVTFDLGDPAKVDSLYLKAHRLAYRDASTNPNRGAKGSVRLNGGDWVDLSNETPGLECSAHEAAYGCLNGAYHTVRLSVPIEGARTGTNTLEFRFNGTDKLTSGYRIVAFNLQRGDEAVLPVETFAEDDPVKWEPPLSSAKDIREGQRLWEGAALVDFPGGPKIRATCSGCHAVDGRDLQYYAFSNWSIQERAKFHKLSELEGKQIASYIRSLDVEPHGRPWNPPYQPGPGLDSKPVEQWAAGAGLDAVLEKDEDMKEHLFPSGTSDAAMRKIVNKNATLNVREMPVSLQFPDWQAWLPEAHPLDIWGQGFETSEIHHGETYPETYERVRRELEARGGSALAAAGELEPLLNDLATQTTNLSSKRKGVLDRDVPESKREILNRSTLRWGAVKTWEVMQEFGLEDLAPEVFSNGEARSWISTRRNVFEIAPHRSAVNRNSFPYQTILVGKYESTAWYQLQLTLNAGNGGGIHLWPVDWNYQPNHIEGLRGKGSGPAHPYRYLASHTKMHQQFADGDPMPETALGFRQLQIHRYVPGQGHGRTLDTLPTSVRANAYEALLNSTVDVLEQYRPSDWARGKAQKNVLEPANYRLTKPNIPRDRLSGECHTEDYANCWYSAVPYFEELGVDDGTLERLVNWGQSIWPRNDWKRLTP